MSAPTVDVPDSPADLTRSPSLGEYFRGYVDRVRGGDIGSLPAVFGLIVLVIVFSILRPVFFSAGNFANLLTQGAPITVIAMGLVFVLLLGEIDLSAGFTSGVCAAVLATLLTDWGWSWPLAVLVALPGRPAHRDDHGLAGGPGRDPVVRGHPGRVPGLPGNGAADHRRGRQRRHPRRDHPGHREQEPAPAVGLGPVGGVDRRLRRRSP